MYYIWYDPSAELSTDTGKSTQLNAMKCPIAIVPLLTLGKLFFINSRFKTANIVLKKTV